MKMYQHTPARNPLALLLLLPFCLLHGQELSRDLPCIDLKGVPLCGTTSYLKEGGDWSKYHVKNLFDGAKDTAWVEGAEGDGIGEEVWFEIEPGVKTLVLWNGYAKNQTLFLRNNRVKKIELRVWVGVQEPGKVTEIGPVFKAIPASPAWTFDVKDSPAPQSLTLGVNWNLMDQKLESLSNTVGGADRACYFLVITLREVFRGSHYRDTCIAELSWQLDRDHEGPSGIGKLDIRGDWVVEKGSPWESVQIEWVPPLYQKWSSFLHGQLFDAGSWEIGKGVLKLWSDGGSGDEFLFVQARKEGGKLILEEPDGTIHVWQKGGP